jgi:glycosyltransferase involved in cell wall biosynthesis
MTLLFDQRWCKPHGIGRFASEMRKRIGGMSDITLAGSHLDPRDPFRLSRYLRRIENAAYFTPGYNVPFRPSCPTVSTIHDLIHVQYPAERSLLKSVYYRCLQAPVIRRSPLTFTVSEFSRDQIINWYGLDPNQVVCVGNGVSDEFCANGPVALNPRPYLLYVGNTKPHKNVQTLLEAISLLDADLELKMVIQQDDWLQSMIEEYKLSQHVNLIQHVNDAGLAKLYRGAQATILPSHYEGFGLPLIEAMACSCPVIAADRTSIPEVLAGNGWLFDADNVDELVDQIRIVIDRSSAVQQKVTSGLARAAEFSWASVARRARHELQRIGLLAPSPSVPTNPDPVSRAPTLV